jgi:hypothetical protein
MPAPRTSTTRTSDRAASAVAVASSSVTQARSSALSTAGRLSVTRASGPPMSSRIARPSIATSIRDHVPPPAQQTPASIADR